jgi:hypothetical protein
MHICIDLQKRIYTCKDTHTQVHIDPYAYTHARMYTNIQTYTYILHTHIFTYIYVHTETYVLYLISVISNISEMSIPSVQSAMVTLLLTSHYYVEASGIRKQFLIFKNLYPNIVIMTNE